MEIGESKLFPNYDESVLLRSCKEEITAPLGGTLTGEIPSWLRGNLLRNGPGTLEVGDMSYEHLFDGAGLLHKFAIYDGKATYQCRFLQSETYKKNQRANRIVVSEFATKAVPDPCHTIFDRVSAIFNIIDSFSDNAQISIIPFADEVYALTEFPSLYRIDPDTLDTLEKKKIMNGAVLNHSAHPHVMPNGDVYNIGMSLIRGMARHVVVKFPFTEKGDMFKEAHIVGTMAPRWTLHPAYMHSFGVTENYFVMVEQPLTVSLPKFATNKLYNEPMVSSIQWFPGYETHIVLISRADGTEVKRYRADTFFFVHMINSYEKDGQVVIDVCTYKDAKLIDSMYTKALKNMQGNADYAEWFKGTPHRFVMPLEADNLTKVVPKLLTEEGCEMPRINYEYNGRPYRHFYGIHPVVDVERPGGIIKVDTEKGETKIWNTEGGYGSEPVFVPAPNAQSEDDGVVLTAVLWSGRENAISLVVLDAKEMKEIARVDFATPSPAPRCLHGWYLPK